MTDAELVQYTGKLHQQINQRCCQMEAEGLLTRDHSGGIIANRLRERQVPRPRPTLTAEEEWFWEANVQAALCRWLEAGGWSLIQVADTASRQQGTDIVDVTPQ